jgi:tetratricopeptide (TPR) repeat protein
MLKRWKNANPALPQATIEEIQHYRASNQIETALPLAQYVATVCSNCAFARYIFGVVLYENQRLTDSIIEFDAAIALYNNEKDFTLFSVHRERADSYYMLENYNAALEYYNEAMNHVEKTECRSDELALLYERQGSALNELERYEESLSALDLSLLFEADSLRFFNKGIVLEKLHRFEDAVHTYNKSILADTSNHKPMYRESLCLYELGRYEEALSIAEHAIYLQYSLDYVISKVQILFKMERLEEALHECQVAIQAFPNSAALYQMMSLILLAMNQHEESTTAMNRAMEIRNASNDFISKQQ